MTTYLRAGFMGLRVIGDCECGHSILYHLPVAGCLKCSCDEFH